MKISKELCNVKETVEFLLTSYEELRDNDTLLFLAYLNLKHDLRYRIGKDNYETMKKILLHEDTPKFESISRRRRKLQEEVVELRGLHYDDRQSEQHAVIQAIKNN